MSPKKEWNEVRLAYYKMLVAKYQYKLLKAQSKYDQLWRG